MPFGEQPVKGTKSATLSVGASDTQDAAGCDYICDGTCDEVEINQAIAALPASGGLVYLCEGTYNVCGPIIIDKSNVAIIGAGASTVIRVRDGHNANINVIEADTRANLLIKDLRIDGNRANQTAGTMHGIYFDTVTHSKIVNCRVENFRDHGIHLTSSDYNTVEVDIVNGNTGNILLHESDYNALIGNVCQGGPLTLSGISLTSSDYNTVEGNIVNESGTEGIWADDSDNNTFVGNTLRGNRYGIHFYRSDNNSVTENVCYESDRDGYLIYESNYNSITGNILHNSSRAAHNTYSEINLDTFANPSAYNSIVGNVLLTHGAIRSMYGIREGTIADHNVMVGNSIPEDAGVGPATANILRYGANTVVRNNTGQTSGGDTLVVAASNSGVGGAWLADRLRADYICDGTADQTEINAAIAALGATGGTVKLLEGTYNITGAINLATLTALVGQGAGTVLFIPDGTDGTFSVIRGSSVNRVLVKDLRVDGNMANQTGGAMTGINFDTVTHSKIVNCWVENMWNEGIHLPTSDHNTVIGNTCGGSSTNISLASSDYNDIQGNTITSNRVAGLVLGGSDHNIVSGNTVSGGNQHGIYIHDSSDHNTIEGNSVINNGLGADVTYDGIFVDDNSDYNNIQGNTVRTTTAAPLPNRQRYGINIAAATCDGNLVKNNDLHQSGQTAAFQDLGTGTRLPSIMVPIFDDGDVSASLVRMGDHVIIQMANGADVFVAFNFRVPDDFHQLVRARIVMIPNDTGDLNWGCTTDWGTCGERYDVSSGAIAVHTEAVTVSLFECLDINAALVGIAAGDHVGVKFHRDSIAAADTVESWVGLLQFWMQYV